MILRLQVKEVMLQMYLEGGPLQAKGRVSAKVTEKMGNTYTCRELPLFQ